MVITEPLDEGQTPLDPDEANGLRLDWVNTREDLNIAEAENIAAGMAWGQRAINRQPVLTQKFLRALHQKMFGQVWEWAGRYRDSERSIGVAPHNITTHLKNLLDDTTTWDELDTYPLDERAARLHHRLTSIHPFPNGNGRSARVFTDCYLEQRGAAQFSWGTTLSSLEQREQYLAALRAADAHDYGRLIAFVRR